MDLKSSSDETNDIISDTMDDIVVNVSDKNYKIGFYRQTPLLVGLNLTVPKANILSIVGPKGSGKTLILQCIAGLIRPSNGKIEVFGEDCSQQQQRQQEIYRSIGYMPQKLSLYDGLTVEEIMKYFGQLYQLPQELVQTKIDYLVDSISSTTNNNNKKSTLIRQLTTNDKVVVSLAITVLHSPRLLLMDEPTRHCDPWLKRSIWQQLRHLCLTEKVTIVATSRHIDESKYADTVALVGRDGQLVEESVPKHFANDFASVDDMFDKLFFNKQQQQQHLIDNKFCGTSCLSVTTTTSITTIQDQNNISKEEEVFDAKEEVTESQTSLYVTTDDDIDGQSGSDSGFRSGWISKSVTTKRISALYYKNLKQQMRNKWFLMFYLLYPALAVSLFCACIGKNPYDIPVGVYNPDRPSFVSDIILKSFNQKVIQLIEYDTFESAYEAVRHNHVWAMLSFPHNYTRSMLHRSSQGCESGEDLTEIDIVGDGDDDNNGGDDETTAEESIVDTKHIVRHKNDNESIDDNKRQTNRSIGDLEIMDDMMSSTIDNNTITNNNNNNSKEIDNTAGDDDNDNDYEIIDEEPKLKLLTTIDLYMDNSNLLISGAIKTQVILALKKAKNRSTDMNDGYSTPLQIVDPNVYGPSEAEMSEFITPGIIIAVIFLSSTLFPGLTLIQERRNQQLERSTLAGVRVSEIILAHLLIHLLILCLQISFIMFVTFSVFDMHLTGSVYLVYLLLMIQGVTGLSYSIAIASVCTSEVYAIIIWLSTFSLAVTMCGTFWPIQCMPPAAALVSKLLPQSIAGNGLRSIISRGWDLSYTTVQLSLAIPLS
ncbi:ABC transporter G family member 23-like [Oppia nitens]|uniref:ABC transporter G family member 23-like n=1 Tax=Oppia nitens TaxID=1686743 RepID=UPI0023DCE222|nr:ABC transporter G family member 23-like [Oppia nitens]